MHMTLPRVCWFPVGLLFCSATRWLFKDIFCSRSPHVCCLQMWHKHSSMCTQSPLYLDRDLPPSLWISYGEFFFYFRVYFFYVCLFVCYFAINADFIKARNMNSNVPLAKHTHTYIYTHLSNRVNVFCARSLSGSSY